MCPRGPRRELGGTRYRTMSRWSEMVTSVTMSGAIMAQRSDFADQRSFASRLRESRTVRITRSRDRGDFGQGLSWIRSRGITLTRISLRSIRPLPAACAHDRKGTELVGGPVTDRGATKKFLLSTKSVTNPRALQLSQAFRAANAGCCRLTMKIQFGILLSHGQPQSVM